MLRNKRLQEDGGFGGVEAGGKEVDGDLQGVFGDCGGVGVVGGQGVPVGYEVEAFVVGIGLELDPVLQGAEVVADVETSGGAHAGDDSVCGSRQVFASVELGDSLQFTDWERKRKNGGEEEEDLTQRRWGRRVEELALVVVGRINGCRGPSTPRPARQTAARRKSRPLRSG